jgi:hypothetical protein
VGSEEGGGGMRHHFWERMGHRGGGSVRGRWRRRRPVGLPEEENGWLADRAGPPISEGEAAGQAGPDEGRERGGPWLGQKGEGERWAAARPETGNGWIKFFQILFGIWIFDKLWKFAQGDSEGILIWGFFLKSSRLLKDF